MNTVHIQTHQVKTKTGTGNWAHASLCDPLLVLENGTRTTVPERSSCPNCIKLSIEKLRSRIKLLEEML